VHTFMHGEAIAFAFVKVAVTRRVRGEC
jgi:hypothetical protein